MIAVRLTTSVGHTIDMEVSMVSFVKECPYNGHRFATAERDRVYCSDSHRVMYYKKVTATAKVTSWR